MNTSRGMLRDRWMEHHVCVCATDSQELQRHLAFRNYLRTNPEAAAAYGQLKRQLAQQFRPYCQAKSELIERVLRKMLGPKTTPSQSADSSFEIRSRLPACSMTPSAPSTVPTTRRSKLRHGHRPIFASATGRMSVPADTPSLPRRMVSSWSLRNSKPVGTSTAYVRHRHQRRGVGRSLYAAIEEEARKLGTDRLLITPSTRHSHCDCFLGGCPGPASG